MVASIDTPSKDYTLKGLKQFQGFLRNFKNHEHWTYPISQQSSQTIWFSKNVNLPT